MNSPPTPEIRIVFTGPRGAGKTTAISTIRSEPQNQRAAAEITGPPQGVHHGGGYDVGTLTLADGTRVDLFGLPSETGLRVLSDTLAVAAAGVVLLLDATQPDVLSQLDRYLDMLSEISRQGQVVIGLGRAHQPRSLPVAAIQRHLDGRPWPLPIISVDVRERGDVILLIDIIRSMRNAEARMLAETP